MTTISTDTDVDQTYITNNTGPYTVDSGAVVTLTTDLTLNISDTAGNRKWFLFNGDATIEGAGYQVTLTNGTNSFVRGTGSGDHTITNLWIIYSSSAFKNN